MGNGSGTDSGHVNLKWAGVSGATGYKVLIFNGSYYEEFDVGNTTSWTSQNKRIWPTPTQISQGNYTMRKDGIRNRII
ncbi:hypothetical protein ACOI1C_10880 [Bacillus sp. DJP31]|uniref:hypothetical protein n=1 Tax=Bacillus sp. DJP31 TaxID=3409789 RepID=UPI003BB76A43